MVNCVVLKGIRIPLDRGSRSFFITDLQDILGPRDFSALCHVVREIHSTGVKCTFLVLTDKHLVRRVQEHAAGGVGAWYGIICFVRLSHHVIVDRRVTASGHLEVSGIAQQQFRHSSFPSFSRLDVAKVLTVINGSVLAEIGASVLT